MKPSSEGIFLSARLVRRGVACTVLCRRGLPSDLSERSLVFLDNALGRVRRSRLDALDVVEMTLVLSAMTISCGGAARRPVALLRRPETPLVMLAAAEVFD
jgi:hypothetical protein